MPSPLSRHRTVLVMVTILVTAGTASVVAALTRRPLPEFSPPAEVGGASATW